MPAVEIFQAGATAGVINHFVQHAVTDAVLLAAPEVQVDNNTVQTMVAELLAREDAAVLTCRKVNEEGRTNAEDAFFANMQPFRVPLLPVLAESFYLLLSSLYPAQEPWLRAKLYLRFYGNRTADLFLQHRKFYASDEVQETPYVPRGVWLLKKDVFEKLGGLDERFGMYYDIDYCERARAAGYKLYFMPSVSMMATLLETGHSPEARFLLWKKHKGSFWLITRAFLVWRVFATSRAVRRMALMFKRGRALAASIADKSLYPDLLLAAQGTGKNLRRVLGKKALTLP